MKKSILIIGLFCTLNFFSPMVDAQSSKAAAGFVITVTAENAGDGMIYISRRKNGETIDLDSARTKVFPVVLKGKVGTPEMLYLRVKSSNTLIPVFTENSKFKVFTDFEEPDRTKVEGSSVHKEFDNYNAGLADINKQNETLVAQWKQAKADSDTLKTREIEAKLDELETAEYNYSKNYVEQNKSSFVTPYIIRRVLFYSLSLDELKKTLASLDKNLANSEYVLDLNDKIKVLETVAIGKHFTDIVLPGVDGNPVKLQDFTGKGILLVDFWASWCGPCRRENPNVVRIYNEFHSKGFDIVGVSLDTDEKAWKTAIQSDGLVWHHMSDLNGWKSKGAEIYGVNSIPHTVLIDKNGTIIAKNVRGEELRALVAKQIEK